MFTTPIGLVYAMEITQLQELIQTPDKLAEKIESLRPNEVIPSIQPEDHEVMDETIRKKREIVAGNGIIDPVTKEEGIKITYEEVTRIPSPIEKNIIDWAAQMAAGTPTECFATPQNPTEQTMYDMVRHTLKSNKVEYLDKTVVRLMGTYKRCAEVWFTEDCDKTHWGILGKFRKRMRMMLLSAETGDELYLVTNNVGDAIALTRGYKIKDEEDKEVDMLDLWMAGAYLTFAKSEAGWIVSDNRKQSYKKASFVYYSQDRLEYEDIIQKRKRLETLDSDHADQNLATGSPILVASKLMGIGKRGETGKVFEVEEGGKLEMLEAAGSPDSLKMERENLLNGIYYDTNTPNMSIFDAEGMGANTPGITIKLRFLPATLKAINKQTGSWGMGVQRRYNFLKEAMSIINTGIASAVGLDITPKFQVYLPSNETEEYANIVSLVGAGLMSKETAIKKLGFTDDPAAEYERIKTEAAEVAKPITPPTNA